MGFTIPNYTLALANGASDQSEPDSVDFQVLGDGTAGVVYDPTNYATNGVVTQQSVIGQGVAIAPYKVLVNGVYHTKGTATQLTLDEGGANPRFDLIVIPTSAPQTPTFRKGSESSDNPVFPALVDGDVLLASVYRPSGTVTSYATNALIVDKRKFVLSNTTWLKTAAPINSDGNNGDFWVDTSAVATGQSMLWVKRNGAWENLAEYVAMGTSGTSNLVLRDASGNFSASTITASLTGNVAGILTGSVVGNATTATNFQNATGRTVTLSGDVTGTSAASATGTYTLTATIGAGKVTQSMLDTTNTVAKVTVSATEPSTVKAGDIWVQI
jgi:hypothetical protein